MENRDCDRGRVEKLLESAAGQAGAYRTPLLTGLAVGLLAHGFAFANKLPNMDDVAATFSKGSGADVGRWALEATRLLFPDVSMPWLYGILTLLLFTVSACVILSLFEIRSCCQQAAFAAVMASFPALTGLYCYMFTSAPYALAFLLAVLSVAWFGRESWPWRIAGCAALILSLGIYQAYLAVAASLYLLLMIRRLLTEEKSAKEVLFFGLRALGAMLLALLVYYLISRLALALGSGGYLSYGVEKRGLVYRVGLAYNAFLKTFTQGYFGYVNNGLSKVLHLALLAVLAVFFVLWFIQNRDPARAALLLLCLALLPLAINCMFLAADAEIIHSLVLHSFVLFYALTLLAGEMGRGRLGRCGRDAVLVCLLVIALSNAVFANKVYFKMYLNYEAAVSYYTRLLTRVEETEGFDEDCRLAFISFPRQSVFEAEELDTGHLTGPSGLASIYTRTDFVRYYLGSVIPFAEDGELLALMENERVEAMPIYPYEGSVQRIDDCIVVKFR